jgi:hemerythrin-like domain-containing protein
LDFAPELLLPNRAGLPSEIAYLREKYPEPQWRGHRNFGEMSDFWLQVHDMLREEGGFLKRVTHAFREGQVDAPGVQRLFAPRLRRFLQHLEAHHSIEDTHLFPRFRALDRRMIVGFDLLENDHAIIHEKLVASAESGQNLVAALAEGGDAARRAADAYAAHADRLLDWLMRHLADEEDLVIPAMLEHTDRAILS